MSHTLKYDFSEPKKKNITTDVTLVGIIYDNKVHIITDINNKRYLNRSDTLLIYNENFDQYSDFTDNNAGGGNGVLRKYRSDYDGINKNRTSDVKAYVYGIPTGIIPDDKSLNLQCSNCTSPFDANTYTDIVNMAINNIIKCINDNPNIKYVIWCVEKTKTKVFSLDKDVQVYSLGISIFNMYKNSIELAENISQQIFALFDQKPHRYIYEDDSIDKDNPLKWPNKFFKDRYYISFPDDPTQPVNDPIKLINEEKKIIKKITDSETITVDEMTYFVNYLLTTP